MIRAGAMRLTARRWRCARSPGRTIGSVRPPPDGPCRSFRGRSLVGLVTDRRQHGEGQHDQRDMAVPAMPSAANRPADPVYCRPTSQDALPCFKEACFVENPAPHQCRPGARPDDPGPHRARHPRPSAPVPGCPAVATGRDRPPPRPHPAGHAALGCQQVIQEQPGGGRYPLLAEQETQARLDLAQGRRPVLQHRLNRCSRHPCYPKIRSHGFSGHLKTQL
jgi:hypothetical protein